MNKKITSSFGKELNGNEKLGWWIIPQGHVCDEDQLSPCLLRDWYRWIHLKQWVRIGFGFLRAEK
jgi:hypothetical protein